MRAVMLLTCLAAAATPALRGQAVTLPPIVRAGFEAYKLRGASAAMAMWMKDSPITDFSDGTRALEQIEMVYGKMVGYEPLEAVAFGTYATRTYLVMLYEKGPVYVRFDCYMPKDQWIVTAFLFNTKPELILPTKMMSH